MLQDVPRCVVRALVLVTCLVAATVHAAAPAVDYNRAVRPLLSNHCFQCHGPDATKRQAGLRLDDADAALKPADSGARAIVPGRPDQSELVRRVFADDPDEVMPPPDANKPLRPEDKQTLKQWIAQGAKFQTHWAFTAPQRPPLPPVKDAAWPRTAIDRFILARLEAEGLRPSPEAERATLIRRLTLDLTGLPPTPAEVDAFLADTRGEAYEHLVDRLLANPHYGERLAVDWLDAARFADTHGFHIDSGRDMTRWREWVINAFQTNQPFDQFTIEQLAGDLLPNATLQQKVASGFQRNHMINFEGGAIPEEYHHAYLVDRVNTAGTVWLGLTIACVQCHEHKYDPISQKEYYQLYAYFNNVPENGLDGSKGNAVPLLPVPSPDQARRLEELAAEVREVEQQLAAAKPESQQALKERLAQRKQAQAELERQIPTTMVMQEMAKPRDTFARLRGQYDKLGEKVTAGVPAFLPPLPAGAPNNRWGLAQWLVHPGHPLTARVTVNRYWQMLFGIGLVRTAEDFGSQGELPSHPELLDWLAVEFQTPMTSPGGNDTHAWNVKALLKLLVMSATYRQSSVVTPELRAKDPENRLLARGPRHRLQAEFIRDQALAVSGLLNDQIGGPSVSPYQPPGIWEELASRADGKNWTAQEYAQSHGRDLYRRTMYTFWKRTAPPPSLVTFDAPDRETCVVRRARTNTPLQALVLMNDPTYVEAARKLAERMLTGGGATPEERIAFAFRLATARRPAEREVAVLKRVLEQQRAAFGQDEKAAAALVGVGEAPRPEQLDSRELAAWTLVASVILNLDETLTKG
jgi:hypothetical protein